ncbi:uncharacterized protein BBOV_IV000770 [Babesia bovis T2Bo]|uniref:DUF1411 domain-containing protein n=1 Tax=Babesia bovis TaxID=5865 RepID=A7AV49_BABBO|nr:uncharacterized protein BBOV_IV000770 [Babesia bovis T2Bo]EDO05675.1 hypothetical protein BBOV_IV000770 [Babesia bovis T2Bo]|eukprot:XP_001609243.1 hypothetical protein [Babesia bovis T2Bo]
MARKIAAFSFSVLGNVLKLLLAVTLLTNVLCEHQVADKVTDGAHPSCMGLTEPSPSHSLFDGSYFTYSTPGFTDDVAVSQDATTNADTPNDVTSSDATAIDDKKFEYRTSVYLVEPPYPQQYSVRENKDVDMDVVADHVGKVVRKIASYVPQNHEDAVYKQLTEKFSHGQPIPIPTYLAYSLAGISDGKLRGNNFEGLLDCLADIMLKSDSDETSNPFIIPNLFQKWWRNKQLEKTRNNVKEYLKRALFS